MSHQQGLRSLNRLHADDCDASTVGVSDAGRLLPRAECERIVRKVCDLDPKGGDTTMVVVLAWWQGELRWGRNRVSLSSDRRDIRVTIHRNINGFAASATTNQTDDLSLEGAMEMARRSGELFNKRPFPTFPVDPAVLPMPATTIWSDTTFNATVEARSSLVATLVRDAESKDLLSAGYLEMRGQVQAVYNPYSSMKREILYRELTQSQCSMTVRHPKGIGSGWAGLSSYNWSAINAPGLASLALDKCVQSLNSVAVEPGRYMTILEPQAVHSIVRALIEENGDLNDRNKAEEGGGEFALEYDESLKLWRTKLGLQVVDERVTISHNPTDPLMGIESQQGLTPITWIERGVLTNLGFPRTKYSLPELNDNLPQVARDSFYMSGGTTTKEEMIATTKRGLLVTRFSELALGGAGLTGFTRDGLWLIENGKISKAVKNFRILESPLFVLNQIEQLGLPELVFRPNKDPYNFAIVPAMVPTLKVRDFSFTHMVDAV